MNGAESDECAKLIAAHNACLRYELLIFSSMQYTTHSARIVLHLIRVTCVPICFSQIGGVRHMISYQAKISFCCVFVILLCDVRWHTYWCATPFAWINQSQTNQDGDVGAVAGARSSPSPPFSNNAEILFTGSRMLEIREARADAPCSTRPSSSSCWRRRKGSRVRGARTEADCGRWQHR